MNEELKLALEEERKQVQNPVHVIYCESCSAPLDKSEYEEEQIKHFANTLNKVENQDKAIKRLTDLMREQKKDDD